VLEHHFGKGHALVRTMSLREYVTTGDVIWTMSLGLRPLSSYLWLKRKKNKIREVVVVKDSKEAGRGRGEVECSNRKMIKEKVAEEKERKKE